MTDSRESRSHPTWFTDDIIDGLRVILQRRGCNIQQGDILVVEQAVAALCQRAKPSRNVETMPSEEETAALRLIESQHHDDDEDAHPFTSAKSMRAALLKAFQLGAGRSAVSETAPLIDVLTGIEACISGVVEDKRTATEQACFKAAQRALKSAANRHTGEG